MKTKSLTKITLLSIFIMSVITAITLNSCQKENVHPKVVNTGTKGTTSTSLEATTNLLLAETQNFAFGTSKNAKGLMPDGSDSASCMTRTIDTVNKPNTVTCNYGSSCVGSDGKTRSGIVVLSFANSDIRVVNNSISVTYQNYAVNGINYNGSVSLTNNGPNTNGNQVIAETGYFISTDQHGGTDTVSINYQIEWLAGENSSPASNWQFSITGSAHGGTAVDGGGTIDMVVNTPVIKNAKNPGCSYCIQGTEQIIKSGQPTTYIDFGNPGGCSGQKAVTQNGVTTIESQNQ